ncbi:hypothetical protein PLESTM_001693000 [Pleodorina starrii]|nr:hypothetical protein PLESTM_001693000 [Pleodorina starrii]
MAMIAQSVTMLPLFGLEVALVAMLAGVLMMPAKRKLSDQLVELQKVYTDLQAQLTAIERSDDYQKAASLLAADPGARANKKKFTAAVSSAFDTCVALKNQMASVSANIAQLEMAMEQPALKVLVSDKSGRVMERPFKDLDYVNDSWVNKAGKEHKALKRENRELNQIYHAFQKVNRSLEDEREARRDDAPPEQMEELEKATNDAITDGENLLTDLYMRLRKATLVGWEAVESLDLPDCCKSEEERSKLFSAHKRVAAERECELGVPSPGCRSRGARVSVSGSSWRLVPALARPRSGSAPGRVVCYRTRRSPSCRGCSLVAWSRVPVKAAASPRVSLSRRISVISASCSGTSRTCARIRPQRGESDGP